MQPTLTSPAARSARKRKRWVLSTLAALGLLTAGVVVYHNVNKDVTAEDKQYIGLFVQGIPTGQAEALSYPQQIAMITAIQDTIMSQTATIDGIPHNEPREPKNLYEQKEGMCYDRSRVMEKIFMSLGFTTRHVSLYSDQPNKSVLQELTQPQIPSHATLEVLTKQGWLIVDSNHAWLALDQQLKPYSLAEVNDYHAKGQVIKWMEPVHGGYDKFYNKPVTYIYGLYSRHGKFYPPYTPVPDYNLRELLYNL